jgi:hypothetical protein
VLVYFWWAQLGIANTWPSRTANIAVALLIISSFGWALGRGVASWRAALRMKRGGADTQRMYARSYSRRLAVAVGGRPIAFV